MYQDDSLTLHTDLYQINMMQVYFNQGIHNKNAVFEIFFRKEPFANGYAVFAGLQRMVEYLENLRFTEEDVAYLRSLNMFQEDFLEYLSTFHFTGDIYAIPEGTVVFPREPIVKTSNWN